MTKWRRLVLCFAHGEEAGEAIVVCIDKRARSALLSSYDRLNFGSQCVDFWLPYKIGQTVSK